MGAYTTDERCDTTGYWLATRGGAQPHACMHACSTGWDGPGSRASLASVSTWRSHAYTASSLRHAALVHFQPDGLQNGHISATRNNSPLL
jgi:hypothetical protein